MVFIQVLCMMAHMHLIFVLLMFKKYNESSLNPAWRPPLWFPHSHQFCSDNQTFWKLNSPLLLSILVLHFFLLFFSCVCLSLHIYAFISAVGQWVVGQLQCPGQYLIITMACDISHLFFVIVISMVPSILMKFITCQEGCLTLSCVLVY